MNNSVYGKTVENLRKRIKIRIVKNSQDFIKYKSRPTWVNSCNSWKENVINLKQTHILGFTVLKTSKWEIYNFHDNLIRKFNTRLLFTDTDSSCYELDEKDSIQKNVQVQRTIWTK